MNKYFYSYNLYRDGALFAFGHGGLKSNGNNIFSSASDRIKKGSAYKKGDTIHFVAFNKI